MLSLPELGQLFESYRRAHAFKGTVAELYAPAQYLMDLGGKRIRPLSTLVAHQLYHDEVDLLAGGLSDGGFSQFFAHA